jgi:LmbE family N-acetylglucosaminyl deacetylase
VTVKEFVAAMVPEPDTRTSHATARDANLAATPTKAESIATLGAVPRRILAIAAHPDDLDFGAAGTTAALTAAGDEVVYCLVTDGEAGGFDNSVPRSEMARIRRREQTAAAAVVGVSELHFLGAPDGRVVADLELRKALSRVIRQLKPDLVLTQSPVRDFDRVYASHPDHLATGEASLAAVYPDSRNEFAHPELLADEGLEPHVVPVVWMMAGPELNHFVDITDTFDAKIEALLCHHSQMREPERIPDMMREWARHVALLAGFEEGRLAEGFRLIQTG